MTAALGVEIFWRDQDALDNGVILVLNVKGFGLAHAKQCSIQNLTRFTNILLVR